MYGRPLGGYPQGNANLAWGRNQSYQFDILVFTWIY
jgi:hypothetical protein